jgi:hypothetical protein
MYFLSAPRQCGTVKGTDSRILYNRIETSLRASVCHQSQIIVLLILWGISFHLDCISSSRSGENTLALIRSLSLAPSTLHHSKTKRVLLPFTRYRTKANLKHFLLFSDKPKILEVNMKRPRQEDRSKMCKILTVSVLCGLNAFGALSLAPILSRTSFSRGSLRDGVENGRAGRAFTFTVYGVPKEENNDENSDFKNDEDGTEKAHFQPGKLEDGSIGKINGKQTQKKDDGTIRKGSLVFLPNPADRIQDVQLLLFDVFLILNLTLSASFWVVYRLDVAKTMTVALNEGCVFAFCWIVAGVFNDAFRSEESSIDVSTASLPRKGDEGLTQNPYLTTAINTFLTASVLRLVLALFALAASSASSEAATLFDASPKLTSSFLGVHDSQSAKLIPLEFGLGAILMTTWRMIHAQFKVR